MFAHLHVRSGFSFLYGAATPEALAARGAALSMPALALTDRAGVYGAVRFTKAARKAGVRPIIGAEVPLENGSWLVLLVESAQGYANLCRLLTAAHLGRERGHPAASLEQVATFSRGLVCLSGGRDSQLFRLAAAGEERRAWRWLVKLKDVFGGALYVEVIDHGLPGFHRRTKTLTGLAGEGMIRVEKASG
jgi:error-prone DNA polymerase